jgi:hypothetical protein
MVLDSNLVEAVSKYNVPSVVRGRSSKAKGRLCWWLGGFKMPVNSSKDRRDPQRFFCPPLPAQQAEQHPCILNRRRFGLAPVTCGGAWANLQIPPCALWVSLWRVESGSIPLARQTGSSTAARLVPRLSFSGRQR